MSASAAGFGLAGFGAASRTGRAEGQEHAHRLLEHLGVAPHLVADHVERARARRRWSSGSRSFSCSRTSESIEKSR